MAKVVFESLKLLRKTQKWANNNSTILLQSCISHMVTSMLEQKPVSNSQHQYMTCSPLANLILMNFKCRHYLI